ncbi:hypothetical protein HDU96_009777 [Phlyctochytrium bullatum]|nr:hypothetical protein HDU96_009777 [Phlyctochytrium bullatum]
MGILTGPCQADVERWRQVVEEHSFEDPISLTCDGGNLEWSRNVVGDVKINFANITHPNAPPTHVTGLPSAFETVNDFLSQHPSTSLSLPAPAPAEAYEWNALAVINVTAGGEACRPAQLTLSGRALVVPLSRATEVCAPGAACTLPLPMLAPPPCISLLVPPAPALQPPLLTLDQPLPPLFSVVIEQVPRTWMMRALWAWNLTTLALTVLSLWVVWRGKKGILEWMGERCGVVEKLEEENAKPGNGEKIGLLVLLEDGEEEDQ